jgi:hypothetical protein
LITPFIHEKDRPIIDRLCNVRSKFWIAGGTVLNWYQHRPADSDIDLFFHSEKDFDKMNKLFSNAYEITPSIDDVFVNLGAKKTYETVNSDILITDRHQSDNAITYTVTISGASHPLWKVQLIKRRFYNTIEEVIDDFDISVCQIATDSYNKVVTSKHFAEDFAARRLRFVSTTPSSAKRLIKYWTYGFTPTDEDIQSVIDCPDLDITRREDDY